MDSSVSPKDETWFLRVCHHISNAVYRTYFPYIFKDFPIFQVRNFFGVKCVDTWYAIHEFVNTVRKRRGITVICLPCFKRIIHDKTAAYKLKEKYRPVPILQAVQLKTEPRRTARLTALHSLIQHCMGCQYQNFV